MGRRRRDEDSESESGSEGSAYDDYSDAYDESGYDDSGSENEEDLIADALKDAGLKKHVKTLLRGGIDSISAAQKLNDKKLSKLGVSSSSDRKKIIKALEDIEEGSGDEYSDEYDDEEELVQDLLKKAGLKKYVKYLEKGGIETFKKADKLTESKLKKLGVSDSSARKDIVKAFAKGKEVAKALKKAGLDDYADTLRGFDGSATEKDLKKAGVESGDRKKVLKVLTKAAGGSDDEYSSGDEEETVKKLLAKANMKKYFSLFQKKGIDTVDAAKALQHKDLREMGIHLYRERRDIIEEFEKYNGEELSSVGDAESDEEDSGVNMVHEVLRQQYMSRHIPDFDRMGITTLRQARKLTQTQLRSMGVALYLQRERLINAFADYRPKNKDIQKILIDCNLASHAREFEKLIDVEDAKQLTHSDLRAMGINLYGQRERLMRAFMEHKKK